jgi:ubiquitin-like domain-containing CTD phosphatase 1
MGMDDPHSSPQIISALPDILPSTNESKKPKLLHMSEINEAVPDEILDPASGEISPLIEAIPLPDEIEVAEEWWDLKMSWSGKVYDLKVGGNDMYVEHIPELIVSRVYDFRAAIETLTSVPAVRQKLIGLIRGKLGDEFDSTRFASLGVKKGCKFTMIGTPEDLTFKDPSEMVLPEVSLTMSKELGLSE